MNNTREKDGDIVVFFSNKLQYGSKEKEQKEILELVLALIDDSQRQVRSQL